MAANGSPGFLYPPAAFVPRCCDDAAPRFSSFCALPAPCPDFEPAVLASVLGGPALWERRACLWTCCGCHANGR